MFLKPFKNLAVRVSSGLKTLGYVSCFYTLIKHCRSIFKHYAIAIIITLLLLLFCYYYNDKNYNLLDCDYFKKLLFSTNSLANLLSDSLLADISKANHVQSCILNQPIIFKVVVGCVRARICVFGA